MALPFIGEIRLFGGNFAPRGYAFCDGQLVAIAQNDALFTLIGTIYGGDGQTTFALPDLRGRIPLHRGQGAGGSAYTIGQVGGTETVTLLTSQLPSHAHVLQATAAAAQATAGPAGSLLATASTPLYGDAGGSVAMGAAVGNTGGGQPHGNLAPYQCVNFVIALEGVFPSRN